MIKSIFQVLFSLAFVASLILPASQPAFAQGNQPNVQRVRYMFMDRPILSVGEKIEFVDVNGELAIRWEHRVGWGYTKSTLLLEGVEINITVSGESSSYRKPRAGDVAIISELLDRIGSLGERQPDGIVDRIEVDQYREWKAEEVAMLELAYQFREELYVSNLVFVQLGGDCGTGTVTINGNPAALGLWGHTYLIPVAGGKLSHTYGSDHPCGKYGNEGRGSVYVKPGDFVIGGPTELLTRFWPERHPRSFCDMLKYESPRWQPQGLPVSLEYGTCGLRDVNDVTARGILPRMGFVEYEQSYGEQSRLLKAFVFSPYPRRHVELPVQRWLDVETLEIGGAEFQVVPHEGYNRMYPELVKVNDKSQMIYGLDWEYPVVFVEKENIDYSAFDWKASDVIRVIKRGESVVIQKAIFN